MGINAEVEDIMRAHALHYAGPLASGPSTSVHRVVEAARPWVLKCCGSKPGVPQRELDFDQGALQRYYQHLLVPRLIHAEDGYMITEFMERKEVR